MTQVDPTSHVAAIIAVAEEISRVAPDCAERALKIVELARELEEVQPDRTSIQDAIESQMIDDEVSETKVRNVTSAVLGNLNDEP
jgi:hypothetical protein